MYHNKTPRGGRPNVDTVVMVKLLVLQSWYGLSDPELERQVDDRLARARRVTNYLLVRITAILCARALWVKR